MRKAEKTAFGGVAAALSVVLMLAENLAPVLMYVIPIVTGLIVLFADDFLGRKYAIGVFAVTSLLSLLISVDKEAALTYVLFFGYYPLIREKTGGLNVVVSWLIKLVLFNAAAVATALGAIYIFGVSPEDYGGFGKYSAVILLLMGNAAFVLYEICLTKNRRRFKLMAERFMKKIRK